MVGMNVRSDGDAAKIRPASWLDRRVRLYAQQG